MRKKLKILRHEIGTEESYWQTFLYETKEKEPTVAAMLHELNQKKELVDIEGELAKPIKWECSCMQAKCGACAMLVNGMPVLACDTKLNEDLGDTIELMPLQKFPVVEDLIVDRKEMFENLKELQVWLDKEQKVPEEKIEEAFETSRCIQCGCCLEICTSFVVDGGFMGASGVVHMARLLAKLPDDQRKNLEGNYRKYIYEGCEKYNACHHVCPAGIDIAGLMAHSDAALVLGAGGV